MPAEQDALEAVDRYERFIERILEMAWNGSLDGGDVQDEAEKRGVIAAIEGGYNPEEHYDQSGYLEPGDKFYRQIPDVSVVPTLRSTASRLAEAEKLLVRVDEQFDLPRESYAATEWDALKAIRAFLSAPSPGEGE